VNVIHRRSLEVFSVRQDLRLDFLGEDPTALAEPTFRLAAREERPCQAESLGVLDEVVAP
jgi:hypothetical protein